MNVTDAKIKFVADKTDKLKAFCSITIDNEFVIRDIKIVEGARGCFVAMPSRKLMDRCPSCGGKNHLRAAYCNDCGAQLKQDRVTRDPDGRAKLHADIAHPINSACRDKLQNQIIEAYNKEVERSKQPGYVPRHDEDFISDGDYPRAQRPAPAPQPQPQQVQPPRQDSFSGGII